MSAAEILIRAHKGASDIEKLQVLMVVLCALVLLGLFTRAIIAVFDNDDERDNPP